MWCGVVWCGVVCTTYNPVKYLTGRIQIMLRGEGGREGRELSLNPTESLSVSLSVSVNILNIRIIAKNHTGLLDWYQA